MNERDVSGEISLENGRSNPFGWSSYDISHRGLVIGKIYCGEPEITHPDYRHEIVADGDADRLVIYRRQSGEVSFLEDIQI